MVESDRQRGVGVFSNRQEAEQALNELKASGFPMDKVSIIAKQAEENDQLGEASMSDKVGNKDVSTATGVAANTMANSALGTVLVGLGSLAIPGIGSVIAAGTLGLALTASTAAIGVEALASNGLVNALTEQGIPEKQASIYRDRLLIGRYLVFVDGTEEEIDRAKGIFSDKGIEDWGVYNSSPA
ncbi:general stress protein [Capilliphycus salinus ALCB114379]|uniref:general stress protein n=1 Tax=Capilliphycus salinus TaxID=2768948 RepID=UPI0039A43D66